MGCNFNQLVDIFNNVSDFICNEMSGNNNVPFQVSKRYKSDVSVEEYNKISYILHDRNIKIDAKYEFYTNDGNNTNTNHFCLFIPSNDSINIHCITPHLLFNKNNNCYIICPGKEFKNLEIEELKNACYYIFKFILDFVFEDIKSTTMVIGSDRVEKRADRLLADMFTSILIEDNNSTSSTNYNEFMQTIYRYMKDGNNGSVHLSADPSLEKFLNESIVN